MKKIGFVEYINALPFTLPLKQDIVKIGDYFCLSTPQELNFLLKNKILECALTSSVTYLDGTYHCLPNFGIAAHKEILSVNLYIRTPLSTLSGKTIALTSESATSVSLLKVLCEYFWRVKPLFIKYNPLDSLTSYDGLLIIGDAALKHPQLNGFITIDLAKAWYEATNLPFVFALFIMHPTIDQILQKEFEQQMDKALKWSMNHMSYIHKIAEKQCPIPPKTIKKYYQVCKYRLGKKEFKSLELFKSMRANVSL